MKKLSFLLIIVLVMGVLVSCEGIGSDFAEKSTEEDRDFTFSYSIDKTEYTRGETINITATVTNSSGRDYVYTGSSSGFFPSIGLYWIYHGTEKGGILEYDPICVTSDVVVKRIKHGESGSIVYSFKIPDDAMCTDYSMTLSYKNDSKEFLGVLRIVDNEMHNDEEKYEYSPAEVISGSGKINPIRCFLSSTYYNGDTFAEGCGAGVSMIFGNENTDQSTFPVLVLDGSVEALVPVNCWVRGVTVYDLEYNMIECEIKSTEELSDLAAGEYLIVLSVRSDSRGCIPDVTEYTITDYEEFFKLIVN